MIMVTLITKLQFRSCSLSFVQHRRRKQYVHGYQVRLFQSTIDYAKPLAFETFLTVLGCADKQTR